jgi:beta-galactosidase
MDASLLRFKVCGAGRFRAAANGDPTSLDLFHRPRMHAFGGQLTVILQAGDTPGNLRLAVRGRHLKHSTLSIPVE